MSRDFIAIQSAIWKDEDFRALPVDAQWAYMMLLSQPDINRAGVITICLGRWAKYAPDMTEQRLKDALKHLHEAKFILADWDTYELWIRTFIKHDRTSGGVKYEKAVRSDIELIQSRRLQALALEAAALRFHHPAAAATPILRVVDTPSDGVSDTPSDGVSDTPPLESGSGEVVAVTLFSPSESRASAAATTSKRGTRLPEGWTPTTPAIDGVTPDLIARELPKFCDYWVAQPGQKGVRVSWDATWRNWLRNTLERRVSGSPHPRQQPEW